MKTHLLLLIALLSVSALSAQPSHAPAVKTVGGIPLVRMEVERLADMNVPRGGHLAFVTDGEPITIGGHTSGFVLTTTAEYYRDGEWHLLQTVYPHDMGTGLWLSSGQLLIVGGAEKALGIGQTFTVERYDPATHTFTGFGCLDQKRMMANALELDSGHVVIAGNWYHDDAVELFDGEKQFTYVKPVANHRSKPYVLRTSADNAIIFGCIDNYSHLIDSIVIDRVRGEAYHEPFFEKWLPGDIELFDSRSCFIGDESKGDYSYLITVRERQRGADVATADEAVSWSQVAIAVVRGEQMSLLPTAAPIPMQTPLGGKIWWIGGLVVDRKAEQAYLCGFDKDKRLYVLVIGYRQMPAPLTLHYSEPQPSAGFSQPVLTADGDLLMAGGYIDYNFTGDNFKPTASVLLMHIGQRQGAAGSDGVPSGWLIALGAALLGAAIYIIRYKRHDVAAETRRSGAASAAGPLSGSPAGPLSGSPAGPADERTAQLMARVRSLMDEEQLYRQPDLKVSDVASTLCTNSGYVSDCIKQSCGMSFSQYVNSYRVEHAKRLMDDRPDAKVSLVATESGFSNESSFFRVFKSVTGLTPKEWKQKNIGQEEKNIP